MLQDEIERVRESLEAGRFPNEASVSQGVVLRLLHALGWPSYDVDIVAPEYSLEGRRVDFALCHPPGKPLVFVEVKQVGQSEGNERHAASDASTRTDSRAGRPWRGQQRVWLSPGRPRCSVSECPRRPGVNISRKQVERIIRIACGVADLRFGRDLDIRLGR